MPAAPRQVGSNFSAPDDLEPLIGSLEQQVSSRRPSSGALDHSKRPPNMGRSASKTAAQPERPTPSGMDRFNQLRATLMARAQQEERRAQEQERPWFRLPRLTGLDKLLRPVPIICVVLLAAGILGTALLIKQSPPKPNKVEVIAPILASEPATKPPETPIEPAVTADTSESVKPSPSGTSAAAKTTAQPLSTEEVKLLISRADALVATADLGSARLFYERAVAAGDAQAAIRLGATYDPSFLSQAGLRFVRADPAAAAHWYARARDLGAVEQVELLLKGIQRN